MGTDLPLTPDRRTAWLALANLFLDTELDERDLAQIARELRGSGLSIDVLERAYAQEVAPACWRNLEAVPGGVWTGFEPDALVEAIQRQRLRTDAPSWWQRWRMRRWTASTRADWLRVKQLLERGA